MARMNLSPPWVLFYHEVEAMFAEDNNVRVVYDDSDPDDICLKLYVDGEEKAEALQRLLPLKKEFAGVTMRIDIIPSNRRVQFKKNGYVPDIRNTCALFETAFNRNDAFEYAREVSGVFTNPIYYIVFRKTVVQYFTDDLGDANGVRSTLYQDIAKEIFEPVEGVLYCTAVTPKEDMLPF